MRSPGRVSGPKYNCDVAIYLVAKQSSLKNFLAGAHLDGSQLWRTRRKKQVRAFAVAQKPLHNDVLLPPHAMAPPAGERGEKRHVQPAVLHSPSQPNQEKLNQRRGRRLTKSGPSFQCDQQGPRRQLTRRYGAGRRSARLCWCCEPGSDLLLEQIEVREQGQRVALVPRHGSPQHLVGEAKDFTRRLRIRSPPIRRRLAACPQCRRRHRHYNGRANCQRRPSVQCCWSHRKGTTEPAAAVASAADAVRGMVVVVLARADATVRRGGDRDAQVHCLQRSKKVLPHSHPAVPIRL